MKTICSKCVEDSSLKYYINWKGVDVESCSTCSSSKVYALDQDDLNLKKLIRALIRFNLNEWDYDINKGGENLETIFLKRKLFFSDLFFNNVEFSLKFIDSVIAKNNDIGISLYTDCNQTAIKDGQNLKKIEIIELTKNLNYNELFRSISKIVSFCKGYVIDEHSKYLKLYRARIGYKTDEDAKDDFNFIKKKLYLPYESTEIGVAPVETVTRGRMNREGFSFLYLSEDYDTAIQEIRPTPGDFVSIGTFNQIGFLNIADFSKINIVDFIENDSMLVIFESLYYLSKLLSKPIGTNDKHQYLYTQIFAEELIKRGFNGIRFNSSLTQSCNYVIFTPDCFRYDTKEKYVFKINKFNIEYDEMELINKI